MSGSAGGDGRGDMSPDERRAFQQRVSELDKRLSDAATAQNKPPVAHDDVRRNKALGMGMQMAMDLVLAPVFGAGIGWGLDKLLGTRPVMLLVFLAFGIAAGILNLTRTYRQIQADAGKDIGKDLPAGRDDDDD